MRIWKDTVDALDAGMAAASWLSEYIEQPCRLVYMPEKSKRYVDSDYGNNQDHVSFADGFPVLLISDASLEALNTHLDVPVPMNRFRPNLVVSGTTPFEEDRWQKMAIGEVVFRVVKPCERCRVITIDQKTGTASQEPLRTPAKFRSTEGKVLLGRNLIPDTKGIIRISDPITVID